MYSVGACVVIHNGNHAVQLCIESLRKYHDYVPLYIGITESVDGAREYAFPYAKYSHEETITHGRMLDHLCRQVEEDYILIMDSDVEFTTNCIERMIDELEKEGAFCISRPTHHSPLGPVLWNDFFMIQQPRIDPSCALFKKNDLLRILEWFSFTIYRTQYDYYNDIYDTGAMIYSAAKLLGLKIIEADWLNTDCVHYGGISFIERDQKINKIDQEASERLEKYALIQERLYTLRGLKVLDKKRNGATQ